MKLRSIVVACWTLLLSCCMTAPVHAQNVGALLPDIIPTFHNASGVAPASLGFLCTYAAGTTNVLYTYQDSALTVQSQDPIRLNAAGRPVNGSTEVSVFLQPLAYKAILYAAGTGNTCNGVTVGTAIRTVDNVYDLAQLFGTTSDPWFDVKTYGRATGNCSTDDTSAIAATITAAAAVSTSPYGSGAIVYFPPGCYHVTSVLTVSTSGVRLVGAGAETSVLTTSNVSGSVITFSGGIQNVSAEKLSIRANPARNTGAAGITINGAGGLSYIRNVWLYDQPIGISVLSTSPVLTFDIEDVNINTTNLSSGIGIDVNGGVGVGMYNVFMTATTSYAGDNAPFVGLRLLDTNNTRVYGGRIQYYKWGVLVAPGNSQTATQNEFHDLIIEGTTHEGFAFEPTGTGLAWSNVVDQVRIDRPFGSSIGAGPGLVINQGAATVKGVQIIEPTIFGQGQQGIQLVAGTDVQIRGGSIGDNSSASANTYDGIEVDAAFSAFQIVGVRSGYIFGQSNTQRYGISVAAGASANYSILSNDLRGNLTAGLSDGGTGAGKDIQGNLNGSVAFIPSRLIVSDNAVSTEPSISGLTSIEHWISKDATAETFLWDSFGTNNSILMRRADGTLGSPTAVQNNEDLGHFAWGGYGATGYTAARGSIEAHAAQTWTDSNQGTRLAFWTTANGSTTPVSRMTINDAGSAVFDTQCGSGTFGNCMIPNAGVVVTVSGSTGLTAPSVSSFTTPPLFHFVDCDSCAQGVLLDSFATNGFLYGRRADGSLASPSAVQSGETLFQVGGAGYAATAGYVNARAAVTFAATENWTNTNQGAKTAFFATINGSTTPTEYVDVDNTATIDILTGGSTTISTGVGSVRLSTVNAATNTVWIPIAYNGTKYYVPGWTTNAP